MEYLPTAVAAISAGSVMLALGMLIGHNRSARLKEGFRTALEQGEADYSRVLKSLDRMKTETKNLSNFMVCMPEFARQINTNLEHAKVGGMIVTILDQMFSPHRLVVFYANEQRPGELYLAESRGLAPTVRGQLKIKIGEGRIGWIAEHQVTMEIDEFQAHARAQWSSIEHDPAGMKFDLYAPMIHDNKLHGVLAIGGMQIRHPEQKKMLKMIADLGSAALSNARLIETIRAWADQDGLTGVLNKRAFLQRLAIEIIRCERERSPLGVFILDVDHFKHYNDTNGHLAGDEVLKSVGKLLKKSVRTGDIVARYGGEEFILAMPDTDLEGAIEAADKVRRVIEDFNFPNQEKQPLGNLTISGGVAVFPADGRITTELIGHADQGLYIAKAAGRNRVTHKKAEGLGDARSLSELQEELLQRRSIS